MWNKGHHNYNFHQQTLYWAEPHIVPSPFQGKCQIPTLPAKTHRIMYNFLKHLFMSPLAFVVSQSMHGSLLAVSNALTWMSNIQSASLLLFLSEIQPFNRCGEFILAMAIYHYNKITVLLWPYILQRCVLPTDFSDFYNTKCAACSKQWLMTTVLFQ